MSWSRLVDSWSMLISCYRHDRAVSSMSIDRFDDVEIDDKLLVLEDRRVESSCAHSRWRRFPGQSSWSDDDACSRPFVSNRRRRATAGGRAGGRQAGGRAAATTRRRVAAAFLSRAAAFLFVRHAPPRNRSFLRAVAAARGYTTTTTTMRVPIWGTTGSFECGARARRNMISASRSLSHAQLAARCRRARMSNRSCRFDDDRNRWC